MDEPVTFFYTLLELGVGFRHEGDVIVAVGTGVSPALQTLVEKSCFRFKSLVPPEGIAPDSRQNGSERPKQALVQKNAIQRWSENQGVEDGQRPKNKGFARRNRSASSRNNG